MRGATHGLQWGGEPHTAYSGGGSHTRPRHCRQRAESRGLRAQPRCRRMIAVQLRPPHNHRVICDVSDMADVPQSPGIASAFDESLCFWVKFLEKSWLQRADMGSVRKASCSSMTTQWHIAEAVFNVIRTVFNSMCLNDTMAWNFAVISCLTLLWEAPRALDDRALGGRQGRHPMHHMTAGSPPPSVDMFHQALAWSAVACVAGITWPAVARARRITLRGIALRGITLSAWLQGCPLCWQ